jgi:hypothetical protein
MGQEGSSLEKIPLILTITTVRYYLPQITPKCLSKNLLIGQEYSDLFRTVGYGTLPDSKNKRPVMSSGSYNWSKAFVT